VTGPRAPARRPFPQHAVGARTVAGDRRVGEVEKAIAGAVGHGSKQRLGVKHTGRAQQPELLDLLGGGKEVALHALGEQCKRIVRGLEAGLSHPPAQPLREPPPLGLAHLHDDARLVERLCPLAGQRLPVELRGDDEEQHIGGGRGAEAAHGIGAVAADALTGEPDLQEPALGEQ
jgi:hypothetical protein